MQDMGHSKGDDERSADVFDVYGRGVFDRLVSGRGGDDERSSSVVGTFFFLGHQSAFRHPPDLVGHTALLPLHQLHQVHEAHPPVTGFGKPPGERRQVNDSATS
ncbi:hypothetical protein [Actinoallomurus sp. CA-142502]|uniref:hypothetical protein n=1 Tax=Actinoallomurus sp. CA-142502 TaxID=3239885 RepID=UPI003D8ED861